MSAPDVAAARPNPDACPDCGAEPGAVHAGWCETYNRALRDRHDSAALRGPWQAVIADSDGFIYTTYEAAANDLFDHHEVTISIRRGTSADFGDDERLPDYDRSIDVAHEIECVMVADDGDDDARYRFAQAQAMAAGLNTAGGEQR